jgi:hypothetical protein
MSMMTICGTLSGRCAGKILFNAVLIVAALVVTVAIPAGTGPVAVFAAPWSGNAAEIVTQAGGQLVAGGRWPWIIMAVSADDDFVRRLYRAGAILVTDPRYAIGCHSEPTLGERS